MLRIANKETPPPRNEETAYIVDLIDVRHTMTAIPGTFEQLTWKILQKIPVGYHRVDIVADSYLEKSIKEGERVSQSISSKGLIKSKHSKIPRDFKEFLGNGGNKNRMAEIIFGVIIEEKEAVCSKLKCNEVYLSSEGFCKRVTPLELHEVDILKSNQEEADTRLILQAWHVLTSTTMYVNIQSPSGDTDVIILTISLLLEYKNRCFLDSGSGDKRYLWLGNIDMPLQCRQSIVGLHSISGNDYVSAFFKKGKKTWWNKMVQFAQFEETRAALGTERELSEQIFQQIQEFVCIIYGCREKSINKAHFKLFEKKQRGKKCPDLALIPPCESVLRYHTKRANTVAYIWRNSICKDINVEYQGWDSDGKIIWMDSAFPPQIEDILFDDNYDEDSYANGSDCESDDE